VSDAGSGSGILRLCRKIPLLFEKKNLKAVCFDSSIVRSGSQTVAQRLFKSFLARRFGLCVIFAG